MATGSGNRSDQCPGGKGVEAQGSDSLWVENSQNKSESPASILSWWGPDHAEVVTAKVPVLTWPEAEGL